MRGSTSEASGIDGCAPRFRQASEPGHGGAAKRLGECDARVEAGREVAAECIAGADGIDRLDLQSLGAMHLRRSRTAITPSAPSVTITVCPVSACSAVHRLLRARQPTILSPARQELELRLVGNDDIGHTSQPRCVRWSAGRC